VLHKLIKLFPKKVHCLACIEAGRRTKELSIGRQKALLELLPNTIRKPRDSKE